MDNLLSILFTLIMVNIALNAPQSDPALMPNTHVSLRRLILLLLAGLFSLLLFSVPEKLQAALGLVGVTILLSVRLSQPLAQGITSIYDRFTKAAQLFPNIAR